MINFALTILEQNQQYVDKIAILDGYNELTYGKLSFKIKQVATTIKNRGVTPGQSVLIIMEDCVDWPCIFLGCIYAGVVPMPLSSVVGVDFMFEIAKFIDCRLAFVGDQIGKKIADSCATWNIPLIPRSELVEVYQQPLALIEAVRVQPDTIGFMSMSSGSTGTPKIIAHRHQVFYDALRITPLAYEMTSNSIMMSTPKMSWGFGLLNSLTCTLGLGATAVIIPELPAAKTIFEYANRFRPTILITTPAILRHMLLPTHSEYCLPDSVTHFHSSGEDLPGIMYSKFLDRFGLKITTSLGQSEVANTPYAYTTRDNQAKGTVGQPSPFVEIKLVNDSETVLTPNQVGEIYVKTPTSAFFYYKNYSKTKEIFVGEWTKTNDCGYYDEQGNIVFVGRTNDMFKVNDLLVSPIDVENELIKNVMIQQIAVAGIANDKDIVEVHAFVVPSESFNQEELSTFISNRLMPHQRPRHIHLIDKLPETITNKKDRKSLFKLLKNHAVKL